MRRTRIYCPGPLQIGDKVTASLNASLHLLRVLRLRPGASIEIFDGHGQAFLATLLESEGKLAVLAIQESVVGMMPSPLQIHLGQGISRGDKMDYTLQKAVELGVHMITPLFTEFSGVELTGERMAKRLAHWRAVVIGACEQCGRNDLPVIHTPTAMDVWMAQCQETLKLMLEPSAGMRLGELSPPASTIALLAGPEGGFSPRERDLAPQHGFLALRLGPRILRTETAAVAAITALQCLFGDMK